MASHLTDAELGRLRAGSGEAVRTAASDIVMPSFRSLSKGAVSRKDAGGIVTEVDRKVEEYLGTALRRLLPGSSVVGEEAVAADRGLLDGIGDGYVWLVDPLDGTSNYVAGVRSFAIMVALLRDGEPVLGYILDPGNDRMSWSTAGKGGRSSRKGRGILVGSAWTRYFPDDLRSGIEARLPALPGVTPGTKCVGTEYLDLASGKTDFALFWRSMPWDHAAGTLIVREAGGHAAYLDGTPYAVGACRYGLLVACDETTWHAARDTLLGGIEDTAGLLGREHSDY